jgi:hypothetical protein
MFAKQKLNSAFSTELSSLYNLFRPMVVSVKVEKEKSGESSY